ncbi:MAG: cell wall-binding repeat-containing protein [Candidatus Limnocylindrales bacterium]
MHVTPFAASRRSRALAGSAVALLAAVMLLPFSGAGVVHASSKPIVTLVQQAGSYSQPVFVTNDGQNDRLFVVERTGQIAILKNGAKLGTPFLDVAAHGTNFEDGYGEQGLLGLAFDPLFATNHRFYVTYTKTDNSLQVSMFTTADATTDVAQTAEVPILNVPHPDNLNHNGGMIAFGPDGHLWLGTGDGGAANDPGPGCGNAQDKGSLLGKILRFDPKPTGGFTALSDNPHATDGAWTTVGWARGLRNPWRWSFDRATGALWIGDVGQDAIEEVDRATGPSPAKAVNFGWPYWEGTQQDINGCASPASPQYPLTQYGHGANDSVGCAIVGGYVYRGSQYPNLVGRYFFSDNCSGTIWDVPANATQPAFPGVVAPEVLLDTGLNVSSFGEDKDGELYVVDLGGAVYKVTSNVQRVYGTDRYGTSAAIAAFGGYATGGTVYVATGANFPDALAGAPLAGKQDAPLLLVTPTGIPTSVSAQLTALAPSKAVILGSTGAVSQAVANQLAALPSHPTVLRYGGSDRYDTAAALVDPARTPMGQANNYDPGVGGVFIATGTNFPDALSAAPVAGAQGWPLLLVQPGAIPAPVDAALKNLQPQSIVVLGSSAVVSDAVQGLLANYVPGKDPSLVRRIGGADRYATSALIARIYFHNDGPDLANGVPDNSGLARPDPGFVATGTGFADALSGGPLAAREGTPLLLVAPTAVPAAMVTEVGDRLQPKSLVIFGGSSAVSYGVGSQLSGYCLP